MEAKILIKTPKGQAIKTEKKLRKWIVKDKSMIHETYASPEDDQIVWVIRGNIRKVMGVCKRVSIFEWTMKTAFNSGAVRKHLKREGLKKEREMLGEVKEMLTDQTTVEIIKQATAEELDEYGKSWWQRIKERFIKDPGS